MAAVAWVGGGIFYLLVLRPAMRQSSAADQSLAASIGPEFRELVNVAIAVLVLTGVVLTFNRLTSDFVGVAYVSVLASKIALAFFAFYLVRFLRSTTYPEEPVSASRWPRRILSLCTGTTAILAVGVIVFLLSDVLAGLFEEGLRGKIGI